MKRNFLYTNIYPTLPSYQFILHDHITGSGIPETRCFCSLCFLFFVFHMKVAFMFRYRFQLYQISFNDIEDIIYFKLWVIDLSFMVLLHRDIKKSLNTIEKFNEKRNKKFGKWKLN